MRTATVIWGNGKTTTEKIVSETPRTFVTADINGLRWWKHTGLRVGAMAVSRNTKVTPAIAKINPETQER